MWATFMYLCRHVNVIRRPVNVCHGFVPSCFRYFCHSNVFHAHACHAIMCHAIVTSCKCLSCKRGHVNERPTSASSCVPSWLRNLQLIVYKIKFADVSNRQDQSKAKLSWSWISHLNFKFSALSSILSICSLERSGLLI